MDGRRIRNVNQEKTIEEQRKRKIEKDKEVLKMIVYMVIRGIETSPVRNLCKLGCVVRMVVDSILPHAESGPNDQRKDAPPFTSPLNFARISLNFEQNSHVK